MRKPKAAASLPASPRPQEVRFDPVDNQPLARLCGALDANLRQIESALDVSIARRGARFSVRGAPRQAARAARALDRHFYSVQTGESRAPARGEPGSPGSDDAAGA